MRSIMRSLSNLSLVSLAELEVCMNNAELGTFSVFVDPVHILPSTLVNFCKNNFLNKFHEKLKVKIKSIVSSSKFSQ